VHRDSLYSLLYSNGVRGNMWHQLRARLSKMLVRVLHPGIKKDEYATILRGLPEGSRLSPTLFGIVAADLIHFLRSEFPDATISHGPVGPPPPTPSGTAPPTTIWIGGLFYVDDLCLMSTCPNELQRMIHACQTWSEKSRLLINTNKSKVMAFHETAEVRRARKKLQASFHSPPPTTQCKSRPKKQLAPFHPISRFPTNTGPTTHLLEEVPHFDYLGLRLDEKLTMIPAKEAVLEKANKALIPVLAVVRSLKYQKQHNNPTLASSPITPLQLWKSSVLPHYLLYLRYFHNPSHIDALQRDLNRSLNRTMQVYGTHEGLLAETGTPPLRYT
jgi:hypothetical protein